MTMNSIPVDSSKFDKVVVLDASELLYNDAVQKDDDGNVLFNVQVALIGRDRYGRSTGEVVQIRQYGQKDKAPVDFVGPAQFPDGLSVSVRVNDKGALVQYWNAERITPLGGKTAQPQTANQG